MARIEVDRVFKRYESQETGTGGRDGRPALDEVSLVVEDGETVSIVGSSGCGKSTLLKVVAGLEYADRGRILYDGHDMTEVRPQERGVGMVFQDYALYPSMKGKGNLAYYFEVHDRDEAEAEQRTREVADLMGVGFELLLGRIPDTLSGGEKQRVAIARCIVREPTLFLMDEPISNLDAKLRERTRTEIKKLLRKFRITTLYVTHDQQEAVFMGDRIAVMRDGRIEQVGTFDDLYFSPVNLFVATFIGAPRISLLPARMLDGAVAVGDVEWPLPPGMAASAQPGRVRLGVRPEGWRVNADNGVEMRVRHVERIFTEQATFLYGSVGEAQVAVAAPLDIPEAETVRIAPDLDRAYLFDADGEAAVHVPGVLELF